MNNRFLAYVIVSMVPAILFFAGPASSRPETASDTPVNVQGVSIVLQKSMSASASKVLRHIVDARAELHAGNLQRAESELRAASTLIDYIKSVRPSTQIEDHIWVAEKHLDFQQPGEVALDLIPIELSLTDIEEIYLVRQAKRHIENTKFHLNRLEVEAAREELIRLRESLAQTEVDLPLTSTEQHISKAFALLAENNSSGADNALKQAEAGVRFVSLGNSTPLARTRRLLWQALEDYSAGHYAAVRSGLTKALHVLEQVKSETDSKSMQEAQRLRAEIRELLSNEERNNPATKSELTGFWHRTLALIEREAENIYHAWRDQQSENHLYRQLIDARFHLFYAEYDLFETGEIEDAKWELKKTINYLQAAVSETSGLRSERIRTIENAVKNLESSLTQTGEKDRSQYEKTLSELRRFIKEK